jgi:MFS family permease
VPVGVLAAALLFNLGQGVLRPSLPLYLQQVLGANYRMVTLIPVVFGVGRWIATLPTGYLLDRVGRKTLMAAGLLTIAIADLLSVAATRFASFLAIRGVGGIGWAMFGTVATTLMVDRSARRRRGRAVSLLLMCESVGLFLGTVAGGGLYQSVGTASPFLSEAACMVLAALIVLSWRMPPEDHASAFADRATDRGVLREIVRTPGVRLVSGTSAALAAVQTGVLVFLFPLYLAERAQLSPASVGYVVGLSVLGRVAALWIGGAVSDRRDRMSVLAVGLLGYGVVLGTVTFVTAPLALAVWSMAIGAGGGFVAGLPTSIVGDRVAAPSHGVAIGWLRTVTDTGMLLGPLVSGVLADAMDLTAPFLAAGAMVCALAWACRRMSHPVQIPGDGV